LPLQEAETVSSEEVDVGTESNESTAALVETSVEESKLEATSTTEDASAFESLFP
jgi:hypothetical protein